MSDLVTSQAQVPGAPGAPSMQDVVAAAVAGTQPAAEDKSDIQREPNPDTPEEVKKNVEELNREANADKSHWKETFERMRYDAKFAAGKNQWPNQRKKNETRYIANITGRHINQRVSSVYAKNPTFVAKRHERLKFKLWDGNPESYQAAQQMIAAAQQQAMAAQQQAQASGTPIQAGMIPGPPEGAIALVKEVAEAAQLDQMLEKMGDTARIMLSYFVREQEPNFKKSMKRVVRRTKTVGVGYVRMGFRRANQTLDATEEQGLIDYQRRLETIEQIRSDIKDGETDENSAEAEKLKNAIQVLLEKKEVILREGLVWDFPDSTCVIPDRNTGQLDGFVGAERVTVEHPMTIDRVKQVYKKDIGANYKAYSITKDGRLMERSSPPTDPKENAKNPSYALVREIYHRPTGVMYTVADGYAEYLAEPKAPDVDLERFYPIYTYVTNEPEDDEIFPVSDVKLIEPAQIEYNRRREAEKQHRIAGRPLYVVSKGKLVRTPEEGTDDIRTLANHPAHGIVELEGLAPGEKVGDVIQPLQKVLLDPRVYETETVFQDIQRVVGSQEVDLGGVSGATATEVGVADSKRLTSEEEDVDALDMLLSEIARDATKIMLKETSQQTAVRIAGVGAVWPTMTREQIAEELYLDVEAGSSGRPNQTQEINKLKQVAPTIQATPGINPGWWARKVVRIIDPAVDLSEAVTDGLPAMIALNKQAQPSVAPAGENPEDQGGEGGDNSVKPPGTAPVPEPTFPAAGLQG